MKLQGPKKNFQGLKERISRPERKNFKARKKEFQGLKESIAPQFFRLSTPVAVLRGSQTAPQSPKYPKSPGKATKNREFILSGKRNFLLLRRTEDIPTHQQCFSTPAPQASRGRSPLPPYSFTLKRLPIEATLLETN